MYREKITKSAPWVPELDGRGGVSEIQTLSEFKPLFFKDGFPNKNSRIISLLHGRQADSVASDQCYSEHLL